MFLLFFAVWVVFNGRLTLEIALFGIAVAGVVFAFVCAAGGTWLLGVRLGGLVMGAYFAMAADECVRAVFMFLRWHRGNWKTKKLS